MTHVCSKSLQSSQPSARAKLINTKGATRYIAMRMTSGIKNVVRSMNSLPSRRMISARLDRTGCRVKRVEPYDPAVHAKKDNSRNVDSVEGGAPCRSC
jgi:hypothetical protein